MERAESAVVRIGADWDERKCVVAWRDGARLRTSHVLRNLESIKAFAARFLNQGQDEGGEGVVGHRPTIEVAIEAGDPYWVKLWSQVAGEVLVFDGKKTRRFAESLVSSGASDDRRSAKVLVEMLDSPAHRETANQQLPPELRGIMLTLSGRKSATQAVTAASNRLYAALRTYRPSLATTTFGASFLNVLEKVPTTASWIALDEAGREEVFKGFRGKRQALMEALGQDTIAVDPELEQPVSGYIRALVSMVQGAQQAEKMLDDTLSASLPETEATQILSAVKGVGPVLAGVLTLALGVGERAGAAARNGEQKAAARDAPARMLGAVPVTKRSGTKGDAAPLVSMRKAVDKVLAAHGHILGLQLKMNQPWAAAAYGYYSARGKSAGTAFRSIVRSFMRAIAACVRKNEAFDEATYVTALRSKGVEWALAMDLPSETSTAA